MEGSFGRKIGVSRQAVSKWETGDALPEVTKLKLLAETINVTVDFLLDEAVGLPVGLPIFITVLVQILIGTAFVVVGAVVIKKFRPKKADK